MYLKFADAFEQNYQDQKDENRDLEQTLELGWTLLSMMPKESIKRLKEEYVERYYNPEAAQDIVAAQA
jgi:V/A-type H+-transporting ATPase subunit B